MAEPAPRYAQEASPGSAERRPRAHAHALSAAAPAVAGAWGLSRCVPALHPAGSLGCTARAPGSREKCDLLQVRLQDPIQCGFSVIR